MMKECVRIPNEPKHVHADAVYQDNLDMLQQCYHPQCMFNGKLPVRNMILWFDADGVLNGEFACTAAHQGYKGMAHGGLLATIIDIAMTQCLMGHGVAAQTVALSLRYKKPVITGVLTRLEVSIRSARGNRLYTLQAGIFQGKSARVVGTGQYYKIK
jgi:acyl-coenzyme A thioesterase PaaI-like protein